MDLKGNISILEGVKELSDLTDDLELSILYEHLKYIMSYMPEITDKSKLLLSSAYASRDRLTKSGNKLTSLSNTEIRLNHVTDLISIINLKLTMFNYYINQVNNCKTKKKYYNDLIRVDDKTIKMSLLDSLINIYEIIHTLVELLNEIEPELKRILANQ